MAVRAMVDDAGKPKKKEAPALGVPRRKRPSTGRFRDRTLNWFKTGDEIDPDAAPASGEYAPAPAKRPPWVVPAIAGGVVAVVIVVVLAVF
ncbi:MAG TPA: hypothetical protein VML75_07600 [Kofleriaceae bacterium]|nr:hypothetical protein [Kofleriaceae bacterium]